MVNQVRIIKQNEVEEHVYLDFMNTQFDRRYSSDVVEITSSYLPENEGLAVAPIKNDNIVKSLYVVKGRFLHLETNSILETGDSIVIRSRDNHTVLYALEDSEVLGHCINAKVYEQDMTTGKGIAQALKQIQEKDAYTGEHCYRVQRLVQKMALHLNYSGSRLVNLMIASRHHDIGKVYIADQILNKPGRLTTSEYEIMKKHVLYGAEILETKFSKAAFNIIVQHHERLDGSGYPSNLTGHQISEEAKILAICDSYDAMTVDRVYKKAKSPAESLLELKSLAGIQYDPHLVKVFCEVLHMSYRDICENRMNTYRPLKPEQERVV